MRTILRFNDWPLLIKLLVIMISIAVIPLALVGYLNARNNASVLESTIGNAFEKEAKDVSAFTVNFIAEQVNVLESLSTNQLILKALRDRNNNYRGSEEEILAGLLELDQVWRDGADTEPLIIQTLSDKPIVNSVTPALLDFEEIFKEHVEIFITDVRGGTLASTNRLSDYYQADEGWWQGAYNKGAGAVFLSDPEFDESANITGILMAVPIFSAGDNGEILGIVRSTINIHSLEQEISAATLGETGQAQLLNKEGQVILDPNSEDILQFPEALINELLSPNTEHVITKDEEGDRSIFGAAELAFLGEEGGYDISTFTPREIHIREALDKLGWRIIVREKEDIALAPVADANRLAFVTVLVAILLAGSAALGLSQLLTRQLNRIQDLFSQVNQGNFKTRVEVVSGDELGQMANNLNGMLDTILALVQTQEERNRIQTSIQKLLLEVSDVAEGDLTVEAEVTPGMTGSIADSFNVMIVQLRDIISNVQHATLQVSTSANEIQATAEQLSLGSEVQANQIIGTSSAINEMAISIQHVSENATLSATVAEQALVNARQGTVAVQNTIKGMNRIRDQVQETSKRIKHLGERSQEVGEIVQLIRDIAKRTSILALNASLEAATAGEAGRGFAVVAEDVKRLAERSTNATRQIGELIQSIQNETNEAVAAMEEGTREVVEGSLLADQAGQALAEIETVSDRLAELLQSISQASQQQAQGSEAVAKSMSEIAEITQQAATGTKQAAVSVGNLTTLADNLRNSVSAFKLPSSNGQGT